MSVEEHTLRDMSSRSLSSHYLSYMSASPLYIIYSTVYVDRVSEHKYYMLMHCDNTRRESERGDNVARAY